MKNQYKRGELDHDLSNLEADIVWKNAHNNALKHKLIKDINKLSQKSKVNKVIGFSLRVCIVAAVFAMAFVLVKQEDSNSNSSLPGPYQAEINSTEQQIPYKDVSVTFSSEEQDLVKMVNGVKSIFLTEEAVIPYSTVIGEPGITATKENNRVLADITYRVKGHQSLIIDTAINKQGSSKLAYESLVKKYSSFRSLLTIRNHKAILINPIQAKGNHQLIMVSDEFIYSFSGRQRSDDLIKMAESINFIK